MNERRLPLHLLPAIGAIALTLLAFGLRLHRLDFQPLWGDEGWSFYFASMSLGEMIRLTAEDIHPPLYYILLGGWLRLLGRGPEVARFLSLLFGVALVPLAYRVASRLYDHTAGLATAALVTLSPFAIYYSQEVRMYGLVTLLALASVYFFIVLVTERHRRPGRYALGYILTTTAALYTMYYAAFILAFQLVYLIASHRRRLSQQPLHPSTLTGASLVGRWAGTGIRSLAIVVLLYLPWVIYAGARLVTYVQGKRVAEGYVPLGWLRFFASHVVAFSLGHFSDTTRILAWASLLFLPLVLLGLIYRPPRFLLSSSRSPLPALRPPLPALLPLYLLIPLLLGYLINLVYPFTPRYFERTLMLAAPAWWLLAGAGLAWIWRRNRLALAGVAAGLLLVLTVVLLDFYNLPRYRDEDYRPLMAYLRAHGSPDDVLLASYQWQVGLYQAYLSPPRPALFVVPGWGETWANDTTRMRADLDTLVSTHPRLWFPAYQALGRLWETQVEIYLNQSAFPVQVDWSLPSTKLLLFARGDGLAPAQAPYNFGDRLLAADIQVGDGPVEAGWGVVPVSITWQKLRNLGSDHRVALRLTDINGRTWASRDSLPQGGYASFTDLAIGESLLDRHGLAIPAGTPPGEYRLRLSVYDQADERPLDVLDDRNQPQGVEATLASVQVVMPGTPPPPEALPVQHARAADFDEQVRLLGYSLGQGPFLAGDVLAFSLFWQALDEGREPYIVFAQLQDENGKPVALSETPPVYPSQHWSTGDLLRDPHEIPLPATLASGSYRLAVGLLRPDGSRLPVDGDDQVVLAEVETAQRPHAFSPPSPEYPLRANFGERARLVGYDLRGETAARPGDSLTLVLYWQALETFDRPYTVFAHIVDGSDRIVGQRDQVPGNGQYPTTSWVPGEYLTDAYAIPVNPGTPPGEYWIEVGLYTPVDGARLPVTDAGGQPLGDRLLLTETPIRVK
ncbi:MAG: hypothetical protein Kow0063_28350 [Anaerolineae bacterium]